MKQIFLGLAFLGLSFSAGCGGPAPVPVKGSVVYNGQPLADVNVMLVGTDGNRALGATDSSGQFANLTTFKDGDGAIPGEYTVVITRKSSSVTTEPTSAEDYAVPETPKETFPAKYSDVAQSGLKVTVSGSGGNDLKIELN